MAASRPVFTENFSKNLEALREFCAASGDDDAFERIWKRFLYEVLPTLRRMPRTGRPFLEHSVRSRKARTLVARLRARVRSGDELRELVLGDFLILYLLRGRQLVFLAIKHHRQLSFDLGRFWALP